MYFGKHLISKLVTRVRTRDYTIDVSRFSLFYLCTCTSQLAHVNDTGDAPGSKLHWYFHFDNVAYFTFDPKNDTAIAGFKPLSNKGNMLPLKVVGNRLSLARGSRFSFPLVYFQNCLT